MTTTHHRGRQVVRVTFGPLPGDHVAEAVFAAFAAGMGHGDASALLLAAYRVQGHDSPYYVRTIRPAYGVDEPRLYLATDPRPPALCARDPLRAELKDHLSRPRPPSDPWRAALRGYATRRRQEDERETGAALARYDRAMEDRRPLLVWRPTRIDVGRRSAGSPRAGLLEY